MEIIKIKKKFWKKILKGKKKYEYRKVSKGYKEGTYVFVDHKTDEIFGTAYLTPTNLNHKIDRASKRFIKKNYIKNNIKYKAYKVMFPYKEAE